MPSRAAGRRFNSVSQEADRLGVSKGWIYGEIRAKRSPHKRCGDRILLDPAQTDEFLERQAVGIEEALKQAEADEARW